jgi:exopolysaccharide production protein ExoY
MTVTSVTTVFDDGLGVASAIRPLESSGARSIPTHQRHHLLAKRMLDVVGALVGGLVLLPLLVIIAVAVVLTSSGPAFYKQRRVGKGGRAFTILKFRTMVADVPAILERDEQLRAQYVADGYKLHNPHSLLTPVGRFLRASSLDELPQLWNVLRGDMSLVGPRPVVPPELAQYGSAAAHYRAVRPGLTGAWQVGGRSDIDYPERVILDSQYVEQWDLLLDFKILAKTIPAMISRRGAY